MGGLDDLNNLKGFVHAGAVGGKMNKVSSGSSKPQIGQDHKFKIIVCGNKYLCVWAACILSDITTGIICQCFASHIRAVEFVLVRADGNVQVLFINESQPFVIEEANQQSFGLIFDGGQARI